MENKKLMTLTSDIDIIAFLQIPIQAGILYVTAIVDIKYVSID